MIRSIQKNGIGQSDHCDHKKPVLVRLQVWRFSWIPGGFNGTELKNIIKEYIEKNLKDEFERFVDEHTLNLKSEAMYWEEYYDWQKQCAETINIQSYFDVFKASPLKDLTSLIKLNQCYDNAYKLLKYSNYQIGYVEGYVLARRGLVRHAWNSHNGQYFDLSSELFSEVEYNNVYLKVFEPKNNLVFAVTTNVNFKPLETYMDTYWRVCLSGNKKIKSMY